MFEHTDFGSDKNNDDAYSSKERIKPLKTFHNSDFDITFFSTLRIYRRCDAHFNTCLKWSLKFTFLSKVTPRIFKVDTDFIENISFGKMQEDVFIFVKN